MSETFQIAASPDNQTKAIQDAIDSSDAPRTVSLTPGEHHCDGLTLRSNLTLELQAGAKLLFTPTYDAYAQTEVAVEAEQSNRAMLRATGASNLTICGTGEILGSGIEHFTCGDDAMMGTRIPVDLRPRVMVLDHCTNVEVRDISVKDSPMWTLHFVDCEHLTLAGVRVDNDRRMPNTDGMVIDGCRHVEIRNCEIRTADDGIVLKTSARTNGDLTGTCSDIRVTNCTLESHSCALKIGTESFSDFRDITFDNCTIETSNRGLGIFSRDGGMVENITFSNLRMECRETPDGFWGSGEAVTLTVVHRRPHLTKAGAIRNIRFSNLDCTAEGAINLYAEDAGLISDVHFNDVQLTQRAGELGTGQAYDIRPTPADLEPSDDAHGRINAWRRGPDGRVMGLIDYPGGMPALHAVGAANVVTENLQITRPTPLPTGWNPETVVIS